MPSLSEFAPGEEGIVRAMVGNSVTIQRLAELGLLEGDRVAVIRFAPAGDPMEVRVGSTLLSLRKSEAACVQVDRG